MKRFRIGLLFIYVLVLLTACSKGKDPVPPEPDNATGNNAINGQMTANINGVAWSAELPYAEIRNKYELQITGLSLDGNTVALTTVNVLKPGKFNAFSYNGLTGWNILTKNNVSVTWTTITSNDCQLEITKLDWANKRISGTFAFVADSQAASTPIGLRNITQGVFTDLPIHVNTPVSTSTMSAMVNNVPWNASGMYINFNPMSNDYSLYSSDAAGQSIDLSNLPTLAPGTYSSGDGSFYIPYNQDFQGWSTYSNSSTTYTITSFDPITRLASGTFNFTADAIGMNGETGTKTISQGTFTNVPVF